MRETGKLNHGWAAPSAELPSAAARFFEGRAYPATVCLAVLLGHVLSAEIAAAGVAVALACFGMLVTDGARPTLILLMTLVFTLSRSNSPGLPSYSGHLFCGERLLAILLLAAALLLCSVRTVALSLRGGARYDPRELLPLALLALGFALNGAFHAGWCARSLAFGLLEGAVYLLPYLFLSVGLRGRLGEAACYFSYLCALCVLLLSLEVLWLYLGPDSPIEGAEVIKHNVVFGWGIWTSMGAALAQLIPGCFVGAVYSRRPYLYLGAATLALAAICFTLSRGALLFGLAAYAASLGLAAAARRHRAYWLMLSSLAALGLLAVVALGNELGGIVAALLDDNGRFRLWGIGIREFLSAPVFGVGFFGLQYPEGAGYFTGADFLPPMMHGTLPQLLASCGLVGALCYGVYRASTLRHILRDLSPARLLVFSSAAVMLLLSLVENYVFQFWPTLTYSVALAVCSLPAEEPPLPPRRFRHGGRAIRR